MGRFSENHLPNLECAMYHLVKSAHCGNAESLYTLARIYLQQSHDMFTELSVEVSTSHVTKTGIHTAPPPPFENPPPLFRKFPPPFRKSPPPSFENSPPPFENPPPLFRKFPPPLLNQHKYYSSKVTAVCSKKACTCSKFSKGIF